MKRKIVSGLMLTLFVLSALTLASNIQQVKASGTIYIRADGSVDPPTAPIQRDGNVYTFTKDTSGGIVVERNNTIIDGDGYTLQRGLSTGGGFILSRVSNVTIKNTNIKGFSIEYTYAIRLGGSDNTIYGNNITDNFCGIKLENYERVSVPYGYGYVVVCYNNIITGNNITDNDWGMGGGDGMGVYSYNNTYSRNIISNNRNDGINLYHSQNSTLWGNTIVNNGGAGVKLTMSERASNNIFYHNNFVNNTPHVFLWGDVNTWDDGYPGGGNYWSDYNGTDANGNGIGDTPYVINANNRDRYPLMNQWTPSWTPPKYEPVTPTSPEVQVAFKAGDWTKYDYVVTGWPSGTPYPEWLKVEILSVEGTTATVRVTMHMSNGTKQSDTINVDVVAGGGTFDSLFGFVIPANSKVGDSINMGGDGFTFTVTIDGETTRTYAGASRTVVYASFSQYGTQLTYYWDKQTGILVESSTTSGGMTGTAKVTETNMWQAAPLWMLWWFWMIIAVGFVGVAAAVYFLRKRKRPTTPPLPSEATRAYQSNRQLSRHTSIPLLFSMFSEMRASSSNFSIV